MSIFKVTNDNFSEIKTSKPTVLLDFYADWCGPCRMISPIIDEIAEEKPEITVGKINVDEESALASMFGVASIPTLVVIKDGEIAEKIVGVRPKDDILELLA